MPAGRPRNHAKHVGDAVSAVTRAIEGLLVALGEVTRDAAARVTAGGKGAVARTPGQRGPGKNNPKLKSAIKASWARYTPAQRKARIAAMLKGRGLKPRK